MKNETRYRQNENRQIGDPVDEWKDDDGFERDDVERFEKFNRRENGALPVSSRRNANSSAKKTIGSNKAKKLTSRVAGGIHRRRIKKIY